jgi:DNA-binding transcriptional LysR family regulator
MDSKNHVRHLRYFVAAAQEMSISRAADRLRVSQPPLSRQIRDLEEEIGTALFDRSNKRLRLTAAGEFFLQEAKRILSAVERATHITKATGSGQAGRITIAFLSPLGGMFLPQIVRSFRQMHPSADIDLVELVPRKQVEALRDRQIDLAFVPIVEVESEDELVFKTVMKVEVHVALPPDHRMSGLKQSPLHELRDEAFIMIKRSSAPATHELLLRLCRSAGFEPRVAKQSDRAQSILDLIAAGAGVAILPAPFGRYQSDVVMRPLAPEPPAIHLCMVWRKEDASMITATLRARILAHFQQQSSSDTESKVVLPNPR